MAQAIRRYISTQIVFMSCMLIENTETAKKAFRDRNPCHVFFLYEIWQNEGVWEWTQRLDPQGPFRLIKAGCVSILPRRLLR